MNSYQITWWIVFIFLFILKCSYCYLNNKYTDKHYSHLNYSYVKKICDSRDEICKSNDTVVCTVRLENDTFVYRDFENSCYLFLSNMCDHSDEEYYIIEGDTCKNYLIFRRSIQRRNINDTRVAAQFKFNSTSTDNVKIQRARSTTTFKPLPHYKVHVAYDDHICPLECPDSYDPVCLYANRDLGKYFKYFTFVNHCNADVYYCKHPEESISTMGHYGWLNGDYRYSHIMEPHQRKPGYG